MNIRKIEKLLELYYNGETSPLEEQELIDFFRGNDIPEHMMSIRDQFRYLASEKEISLESPDFDEKVMQAIREQDGEIIPMVRKPVWIWAAGIAASILIMVAVYTQFNPLTRPITDTYSDPEVAFEQTRKVLLYVSSKFNKGTDPVTQVSKLDAGTASLKSLKKYSDGLETIGQVNKVNTLFGIEN